MKYANRCGINFDIPNRREFMKYSEMENEFFKFIGIPIR